MQIFDTTTSLRDARATLSGRVGMVASTSGIHKGQLALIERMRNENAHTAVCLFPDLLYSIMPDQPAWNSERLARDLTQLKRAGVDMVFIPIPEEIYPLGFATAIHVDILNEQLLEYQPPGQIENFLTLMCRLINLVHPSQIYVGQRHALQAVSIRRMVFDLCIPTQVVICPTVRDADGLPLSNGNGQLTAPERINATVLVRALRAVQDRYARGERSGDELRRVMQEVVDSEPNVSNPTLSVADPASLVELARVEGAALASLSIGMSDIRLSDNVLLGAA